MIVMFHYVRDESSTRSDNFQPRYYCSRDKLISLTKEFRRKKKKFVTYREYSEIVGYDRMAEDKLVCYTFDDATIDHYLVAAPTLADLGVTGSFYSITKVLDHDRSLALPIHQYHVANTLIQSESMYVDCLLSLIKNVFDEDQIRTWKEKFSGWAGLDSEDVLLVKRILEIELSRSQSRDLMSTALDFIDTSARRRFEKNVENFYCGRNELKEIYKAGFEVGSHSHTHRWLGQLPEDDGARDINRSVDILRRIDVLSQKWTVCYPHGSWSTGLLGKLNESSDCIGGLVMSDSSPDPDLEYLTSQRIDISAL